MKLILSHRFDKKIRGSYQISKRFCDQFDDIELKSDEEVSLEDLDRYDHVIFRTQSPYAYNFKLGLRELSDKNKTFFIRSEFNKPFVRSVTNGFSYFKEHNDIKYFCPFITKFPVKSNPTELTIGFYAKVDVVVDSYMWFLDFLKNLNISVRVYTMGDCPKDLTIYPNVHTHIHTNDNVEFHSNVSHYIYPESLEFVDPFPHSVYEAAQAGAQIIIPSLGDRGFKDGIDDLKSFIHYHTTFDPQKIYHNTQLPVFEDFREFYEMVIDSNFTYEFPRKKYNDFYSWMVGEVL